MRPAQFMNDWNIQSRAHACEACARPFADKQPYHTVLFDLKHEIERLDLCEACWKSEHEETARHRKGFLSHWQGVYQAPLPTKEVIQKESAESLLRKMVELNDPKYAGAGFILAAMLERKRALKVKEQIKREGERIFVYEHPKTGEVFTIPDPNLQLNQLDAVQREVADLLEHGLGASAPEQAATAPSLPDEAERVPVARPGEDRPAPAVSKTQSSVI